MQLIELELLCRDLEETSRFYRDCLSFPIRRQQASSVTFGAGTTRLTFRQAAVADPTYHFAFTIPRNQLKEAYSFVRQRLPILPLPHQNGSIMDFSAWNAKSFYAFDNNGNIIEFIARYALDNASATAFSGRSVCAVSEIGIVADPSVPELATRLMQQHAICVFSRQPPRDNFTVLGTDEGLFIIVPRRRPWFPTNVSSDLFRTKIVFKNDHGIMQTCLCNG